MVVAEKKSKNAIVIRDALVRILFSLPDFIVFNLITYYYSNSKYYRKYNEN
jgi:hypothetical protein